MSLALVPTVVPGGSTSVGTIVLNGGAPACGAVVTTEIPDMPRTLSNPIRLSFAEQRAAHPAPALGQHSEDILREAGLSAQAVADLKTSGAVR